jgi:hypothetical protein
MTPEALDDIANEAMYCIFIRHIDRLLENLDLMTIPDFLGCGL